MQMPGPRDIVIYWSGPWAFYVVQKPKCWAHISVQKPLGARGMITGQIDTCIKHHSNREQTLGFYTTWNFETYIP